jgi:hypothetical protein
MNPRDDERAPDDLDDLKDAGDLTAALDALRARHQDDPSLALLRAADADALPAPLQDRLQSHLAQDQWAQAMVRGASAAADESALDEMGVERLWKRIGVEKMPMPAPAERSAARARVGAYLGFAAVAAALVLAVVWFTHRAAAPAQPAAATVAAPATPAPPPLYHLPLDPAPVKLTALALVLRSANASATFADDAAPAFAAYRAADYNGAAGAFAAIAATYPKSVEVRFYEGVSRLLVGDAAGTQTKLREARTLDTGAFADDITWYLAAADDRAGDRPSARAGLDALCRGTSPYTARACAAASQFSAK